MFYLEAEQEFLGSAVWDQRLRLSSKVSWEVSSAQCQRKGTFLNPAESEVCELLLLLLLSATKSSVVDGHLLAAAQELLGAVLEAGAFCVTVCCLNMVLQLTECIERLAPPFIRRKKCVGGFLEVVLRRLKGLLEPLGGPLELLGCLSRPL